MEVNITILLQLAMFLLLMAWLSVVLFNPLLELFAERERRIEGASTDARQLRESADEKAGTIDEQIASAQAEARDQLAQLREAGTQEQAALMAKARDEAQAKIEKARAALEGSAADARTSLASDAEKLAGEIVEKVLGRAA